LDPGDIGIARIYSDELETASYHVTAPEKPFYDRSDFKRLYFMIVRNIILVNFIILN
jgi:hypothetical protein